MDQARKLREYLQNEITSSNLISLLGNITFKRCPASVVFDNAEIVDPKHLAFAKPNLQRDWTSYKIYVREFLENDENGLRLVLSHELCHVAFGQFVNEFDCDNYAAILLGIPYSEYREKVHEYSNVLNIGISANKQ